MLRPLPEIFAFLISVFPVRSTSFSSPKSSTKIKWRGCSSVGRASHRHAADAGSIPRFSLIQLSVQTLLQCPHTTVCNRMQYHMCARYRSRCPCWNSLEYGSTKIASMHRRLGSTTLWQLAFPEKETRSSRGRNPIGTKLL